MKAPKDAATGLTSRTHSMKMTDSSAQSDPKYFEDMAGESKYTTQEAAFYGNDMFYTEEDSNPLMGDTGSNVG